MSPEISSPIGAGIGDDDADRADLDDCLGDELHGGEQAVDVIAAVHQHLMLPSAKTAGAQKCLRILEIIVKFWLRGDGADRRRDDLALGQRRTVMHGDDADHVLLVLDDDRLETLARGDQAGGFDQNAVVAGGELHRIVARGRQHDELREVDGIDALAQNLALRAFLATLGEEVAHILEVVRLVVPRQRLFGRERHAVARIDIADLALRDRHQSDLMHAKLERHEEVKTAAHGVRLEACLAVQRDESFGDRAAKAPQLFQDAETVVGDVANRAADIDKDRDRQS